MSEVLVIGHRNPDTDAICSALGYAEFKRRTGLPEAVAARCGDLNDRVDFVLQTFGVEPPRFVADVSPKVRDVMGRNPVTVPPDMPIAEALALMDEHNIRVLPVLGPDRIAFVNPDCGFWMLKRSVADRKIRALVEGRDMFEGRRTPPAPRSG